MPEPKTITIDKTEYVRKDSIKATIYKPSKKGVWNIGKQYMVETVTKYFHGTLVEVTANELVLMDVAWIPDTKRFHQFAMGTPQDGIEVEPFPRNMPVNISRGALVSAFELPTTFETQR